MSMLRTIPRSRSVLFWTRQVASWVVCGSTACWATATAGQRAAAARRTPTFFILLPCRPHDGALLPFFDPRCRIPSSLPSAAEKELPIAVAAKDGRGHQAVDCPTGLGRQPRRDAIGGLSSRQRIPH